MFRYKLRTLLILLAVGPLAVALGFREGVRWAQARQKATEVIVFDALIDPRGSPAPITVDWREPPQDRAAQKTSRLP